MKLFPIAVVFRPNNDVVSTPTDTTKGRKRVGFPFFFFLRFLSCCFSKCATNKAVEKGRKENLTPTKKMTSSFGSGNTIDKKMTAKGGSASVY